MTSTARAVVKSYRKQGRKLGLLKIRLFRPFPAPLLREILGNRSIKIAVIDRNLSFGATGIFLQELKAALYQHKNGGPVIFGFVAGLGGRDITTQTITQIADYTFAHDEPKEDFVWIGLKR